MLRRWKWERRRAKEAREEGCTEKESFRYLQRVPVESLAEC